jgi:hypothetical protein
MYLMKFWTWNEIKSKVLRDLDLEGETFITETELLGYANEAIDEVERQILTLCEDYFVTRSVLTLVPGEEEYDIPADIYGLKIRQIIYRSGTQVWKLSRLRNWNKFGIYETDKASPSGTQQYGYFILNSVPGEPKVLITPTPTEAGSFLQIWYIRNANELVDDASICDIPEAVNYVMSYIKMKCLEKELHPNLPKAIQDLEQQKADTLKALAEMYPDNENTIEPDYRLYSEMTGGNI